MTVGPLPGVVWGPRKPQGPSAGTPAGAPRCPPWTCRPGPRTGRQVVLCRQQAVGRVKGRSRKFPQKAVGGFLWKKKKL